MKTNRRTVITSILAVFLFVGSASLVLAQTSIPTYYACVNQSSGTIFIVGANDQCKTNETKIVWNMEGPAGPQGEPGPQGAPGSVKGIEGAIVWFPYGSNPEGFLPLEESPCQDIAIPRQIRKPNLDTQSIHPKVWTGREILLMRSGGYISEPLYGLGYSPDTDSWRQLSTIIAPVINDYSTVWSGSEMIVWGNFNPYEVNPSFTNLGGRYNPVTDNWNTISNLNAPEPRFAHRAVWMENDMFIWGGRDLNNNLLQSGGIYNPSSDTWKITSFINAPSIEVGSMFWTGDRVIVWGYNYINGLQITAGGIYDPITDNWETIATPNELVHGYSAAWSGIELAVGDGDNGYLYFYNPTTKAWRNIQAWRPYIGSYIPGIIIGSEGFFDINRDKWINTINARSVGALGGMGSYSIWTGNEFITISGGELGVVPYSGIRHTPNLICPYIME